MFNYVYLLNTRICLYLILLIKRLLRFFFGLWAFVSVTLRGSRKKVRDLFNSFYYYLFSLVD